MICIYKRMKTWISITISIIAFVISIVALAISAPSDLSEGSLDFDYIGMIVGILSFIVTLLIGYQIYTVINVKDELKEIQKVREEISGIVDDKVRKASELSHDEMNNIIPLLMALDMHDNVEIVATALEVFNDSRESSLAYTFSDGLIFAFTDKVVACSEKDQDDFLVRMKDRTKYEYVGRFYGHIAALPAEEKKGFEGVEKLLLKLINKYVTD